MAPLDHSSMMDISDTQNSGRQSQAVSAPLKTIIKTNFQPSNVIEPFYSGGKVAQARDGTLATTLGEHVLITHSPHTTETLRIPGDTESITTLALVPSGAYIITCSRSLIMRTYSLPSCTLLHSVKPHETPVSVIESESTSTLFATGGAEGFVKVWDVEGGYMTHSFKGHGGLISALKFWRGTEGKWRLASGSEDCKIRIWDLVKKSCIAVLENHVSVIRGLNFSSDGMTLVSGARDQVVNYWDMKSYKLKTTLPVYETVEAVGYLTRPDGGENQYIYTGGSRGVIRIWDIKSRREITQSSATYNEEKETGGILDITYDAEKQTLLAVLGDQTLLLFHAQGGSLSLQERLFGQHDEILDCAFMGPQDRYLAIAPNESEIRMLNTQTSTCEVLPGHRDTVLCLDRNNTGEWLASGSKDHEARIWKIDFSNNEKVTSSCFAILKGHTGSVSAVALPRKTKEPSFVITGSDDRTVKCWDMSTGRTTTPFTPRSLYTQKAHDKDINGIDISLDDRLFATASQDRTVKIYRVEDGEVVGVLKGHRRGVFSAKFSATERVLASGSGDATVKLWSLSDFTCLKTFEGHSNAVYKVIFMTGFKQLVSAGGDGLVKVWTIRSGECETTLDNHTDRVWSLAMTANEDVLVSGGGDSVITFWQDTTALEKEKQAKALEERVEMEQDLANYVQRKDWRNAIITAMSLDQPYRLLNLFNEVISNASTEGNASIMGLPEVDQVIATLSDAQLTTLLLRVRDWSTNGRTSYVAQRILHVILRKYPPERLTKLPEAKGIVEGLIPYTDRYLKQVDKLLQESFVVDYILREMDELQVDVIAS